MAKQYPETLLEFEHWFRTEETCRDYILGLRWPNGFSCPRCAHRQPWRTRQGILLCGACRKEVSITAGTIFHGSHLPLRVWFRIIWAITNSKTGVSALGLQRLLGLGSYRTAWTCLHKLRRAMVRPEREQLTGHVEVDETVVGGRRSGGPGWRLDERKTLVAIAVEVRGKGMGRVRLHCIPDTSQRSLTKFVQQTITPGSQVITDGAASFNQIKELGYGHDPTPLVNKGRQAAKAVLPRVHRVAALLKRWLLGVHHGRAEREQMDHYLEEFAFRFNRRLSGHRGMLFFRLIQQCVALAPTPYKRIKSDAQLR